MSFKTQFLSLLFALTTQCAVAQTIATFSPKQISDLQDSISKIMNDQHIASLMFAIVTKDTTLFVGGSGTANFDTKQPVTKQTLFPMASITKTFTALAIMRLVEQGKLSLNDDLKKIAPEVPINNPWENTHPVKVINLLEHTAGFDDVHFNALFNTEGSIPEFKAVLRYKNSMKCRWYPNERMAYCNTDYVILGYLIEKLSEQTYDEFLMKQVLQPIGMYHSNFNENHQPASLYAQGYTWDNTRFNKVQSVNIYGKGEGALYSCAEDMSKFVQFFLNNGRSNSIQVFDTSVINKMEIPTSCISVRQGLKTGYGSAISLGFLNTKYPFYGHEGLSIDFASRFAYNRQLGVGFVICGSDVNPFNNVIIDFLTRHFPDPKSLLSTPIDDKALTPYLGYYRLKTPRFQIFRYLEEVFHGYHIELRGNSLYCYGFKRLEKQLIQTGTNIFRKNDETLPSILLTKNEQGKEVLYDWGAYFEKVSFTQIIFERTLLFGSLFSAITLVLSFVVWLFMVIFRKLSWREWLIRNLSAIGVLFLFAAFGAFAYLGSNPINIGSFNFLTILYFTGTILFALLSIAGFISTIRRFRQIKNTWTKWYLAVTSTWLLYLVFFFYHYDLLGLRMWAY
jgi:CubicO group peptidase (beta-lactamase class C family)